MAAPTARSGGARLRLDPNFVAMSDILTDRSGRQADPIFMVLDFFRATDTDPRCYTIGSHLVAPSFASSSITCLVA